MLSISYAGNMMDAEMRRTADQFNVRMPDGMRERLSERAAGNFRSMNSEIVTILARALSFQSDTATGVQFGDPSPAADHDTARQGGAITHGQ